MQKILMSGAMLFGMLSCNPPTFKKPVEMFAISTKFNQAAKGKKNLNYKLKNRKIVGEWSSELEYISLNEAPTDMMCFSMSTWLKQVKPKLKEAHDYFYDKSKGRKGRTRVSR